jgi:hypothetical protein
MIVARWMCLTRGRRADAEVALALATAERGQASRPASRWHAQVERGQETSAVLPADRGVVPASEGRGVAQGE